MGIANKLAGASSTTPKNKGMKMSFASKEEQKHFIAKNIGTAKGKSLIAAELVEPLKLLRDYETVGRKLLMVDTLGQGEIPQYDIDPTVKAYVVAPDGSTVNTITKLEKVMVPMIEIATSSLVTYSSLNKRKYDVVSRLEFKVKDAVFRKEDSYIFNGLYKAAKDSGRTRAVAKSAFTFDHVDDAVSKVEEAGLNAANITISPTWKKIFRAKAGTLFDPKLARDGWNNSIGEALGCQILTSPMLDGNKVGAIVTADPDTVGVLSEGLELSVLPVDDTLNRKTGFTAFEEIGILVHQVNGVFVIEFN